MARADSDAEILATRAFTTAGQEQFCDLSGDWNPSHSDPLLARRLKAGAVTVHGAHLVLWTLDVLARWKQRPAAVRSLKARFVNPVVVGETATVRFISASDREIRLLVKVRDIDVAVLQVEPGSPAPRSERLNPGGDAQTDDSSQIPRELSFDEMRGRAGEVRGRAEAGQFSHSFPAAAEWLGAGRLVELALLSRLVGMECPGRHSISSGWVVQLLEGAGGDRLHYEVLTADERFRFVRMKVEGASIRATVEALSPPPPVRQPSMKDIAGRVASDAWAGHVALVAGGSRGLGEVIAKVIAAGGGHPTITYSAGADDAQRVALEIRDFGGSCDVIQYEVSEGSRTPFRDLRQPVRSAYYCVSGLMFGRSGAGYDSFRLKELSALYLDGFKNFCSSLLDEQRKGVTIFYPSSEAVESRPRDLTEFAMAKEAGELLCATLTEGHQELSIVFRRLPFLRTDQTVTRPLLFADTLDVVLPLVQDVESRANSVTSSAGLRDR